MEDVGIVFAHFGILCGHLVFFFLFGMLYQEQSGCLLFLNFKIRTGCRESMCTIEIGLKLL
jgi:hypothetical protein